MCKDKVYTDRPMRSQFKKRADYDKAVEQYKIDNAETEADGIRAGSLRLLKARRLSTGQQDQTEK